MPKKQPQKQMTLRQSINAALLKKMGPTIDSLNADAGKVVISLDVEGSKSQKGLGHKVKSAKKKKRTKGNMAQELHRFLN